MAIYLIFLPTGHTVAVRNLAFFSLVLATLWSMWRHELRLRFPLAWPWVLYGALSLFSLTYAFDPLWSLGEIKKEVGYGILSLALAATWVRNSTSLKRLVSLVIAGNLLVVGAVLYKVVIINPFWQQPWLNVVSGAILYNGGGKSFYNGVGNLSTYLVTTLPFIAAYMFLSVSHPWCRRGLIALLGLDLLAVLLTGNRMALIALTVEVLLAAVLTTVQRKGFHPRRVRLLTGMLASLFVAMAVVVMRARSPLSDPRWAIWSWAIDRIFAAPFSGSGFGRTVIRIADPDFYQTFGLEHAHNMILNKGVQMGTPGMLSFLVLLSATFYALWPRRALPYPLWTYSLAAFAMSAGVFLKNMTDDFFVAHNALLYWTLVGAVLGALAGSREEVEKPDT